MADGSNQCMSQPPALSLRTRTGGAIELIGEVLFRLLRLGDESGFARFDRGFFSLFRVSFVSAGGLMTLLDQIQTRPSSPTAAIHRLSGDHPTDQIGLSVLSNTIRRSPLGYSTHLTWPSSPHEASQSPIDDHATRLAPPTPAGKSRAAKTRSPVLAERTRIRPSW
jgi:hypothetical protein